MEQGGKYYTLSQIKFSCYCRTGLLQSLALLRNDMVFDGIIYEDQFGSFCGDSDLPAGKDDKKIFTADIGDFGKVRFEF